MIHVLLRIAVWVAVFAVGYLLFGPSLFDSSGGSDPFRRDTAIYLPPAKPQRLADYEAAMGQRTLSADEQADYLAAEKAWRSRFWEGQDLSVSDALAGVERGRRAHLAGLLAQRGLNDEERAVFMTVVARDRADLLQDRE